MSILSSVGNFFENLVGVNQKKKKPNQPQVTIAPKQVASFTNSPVPQPGQLAKINAPAISQLVSPIQQKPAGVPVQQLVKVNNNQVGPNAKVGSNTTADRVVNTGVNATARAGIGIAQGASDLFDLLTPGKGTNRVGQSLNQAAKSVDVAENNGGDSAGTNNTAYKLAQIPASIVEGGGVKGITDLTKLPGLIRNAPSTIRAAGDLVKIAPGAIKAGADRLDTLLDNVVPHAAADASTEVAPGLHSINPDTPTQLPENPAVAAPTTIPVSTTAPVEPQTTPPTSAPTTTPTTPPSAPVEPSTTTPVASTSPQPTVPVVPKTTNLPAQPATDTGTKASQLRETLASGAPERIKQALLSDASPKDAANFDTLDKLATAKVGALDNDSLISQYGQKVDEGKQSIANEGQFYEYLHALGRLENMGTPEADEAAANALSSMTDFAYRNGRGLAATRVVYADMPVTMKAAYLKRSLTKMGVDLKVEDEAALRQSLQKVDDTSKKLTDISSEQEALAKAIENGDTGVNPADMQTLSDQKQTLQTQLGQENYALRQQFDAHVPKSLVGSRIAQSARLNMLGSLSGRGFDILSTGASTADYLADNSLSALAGKGINLVKGAGTVRSDLLSPTQLVKGGAKGVAELTRNTFGKNAEAGDFQDYASRVTNSRAGGPVKFGKLGQSAVPRTLGKIIHYATDVPTAATKGIENAHLQQGIAQEVAKRGLKGEDAKAYSTFLRDNPPAKMAADAKQAHLRVNNLHRNAVTQKLNQFAEMLDRAGGQDNPRLNAISQVVRNGIIPFTSYLGGAIDRAATDKNLAYNLYRMARARSPQEFADQFGHAATNATEAAALGYFGTKSGLITDKDEDGNNYDGAYIHIGNTYIPVAILGPVAIPTILGNAMAQGSKGGSPGNDVGTFMENAVGNTLKSLGLESTFGDSNIIQTLLDSSRNLTSDASKAGSDLVRQFIPGVAGDVNSALDRNVVGTNPTHEKADTMVTHTSPISGKQNESYLPTNLRKIEAGIPGLAQTLPRETGELAKSPVDRVLHATEASPSQVTDAKNAASQAEVSAQDKSNNVPDPTAKNFSGTLEKQIELNNYNGAIKGLQQKIALDQKSSSVAPSAITQEKNQVTRLQTAQSVGLKYKQLTDYFNTSVSEWRAMGDPTNAAYDPDKYKELWQIDSALAKKKVAGTKTSYINGAKYSLPAKKSGSGSKSSREAAAGGTISADTLAPLTLDKIKPSAITDVTLPTVAPLLSNQLVKKRAISVTNPAG